MAPDEFSGRIDGRAWNIGQAFLTGILLETGVSPKPGLVCPASMGAHRDMNFMTFMIGSAAMAPALYLCAQAGLDHEGEPAGLLTKLRSVGVVYERKLLGATGGVNTQRGILFSAGVLCGAAGLAGREKQAMSSATVLLRVKAMAKGLVSGELMELSARKSGLTAGEKLYIKHGVSGIRGEVEAGFPTVAELGLPAIEAALSRGKNLNDCLVHALLSLMTRTEDTTIIWRKGLEQLEAVQRAAGEVLALGSVFTPEGWAAIHRLDRDLSAQGVSPGGSADLLAVTAGLYLLDHGTFPLPIL